MFEHLMHAIGEGMITIEDQARCLDHYGDRPGASGRHVKDEARRTERLAAAFVRWGRSSAPRPAR